MFRCKVLGTNKSRKPFLVRKNIVERYAREWIGEGCGMVQMKELCMSRIFWGISAIAIPCRGFPKRSKAWKMMMMMSIHLLDWLNLTEISFLSLDCYILNVWFFYRTSCFRWLIFLALLLETNFSCVSLSLTFLNSCSCSYCVTDLSFMGIVP